MPIGGVNSLSLKADEVTIGSGNNTNAYYPFRTQRAYGHSQQIYTNSELSDMGNNYITHITYFTTTAQSETFNNVSVYMQNTDKASFSSKSDWVKSGFTLVYSGSVYIDGTNTKEMVIELDDPFYYEEGKNLIVYVDLDNNPNTTVAWSWKTFQVAGNNTNLTYYNSSSDGYGNDGNTWTNASGAYNARNQIKFTYSSGGGEPETPTAPTAPTVISPEDGTTISGTDVDLSWSYGVDNTATHYQVLLGTDNVNLSPISGNEQNRWLARTELRTGSFATEDVFPIVNLEYGATYYWRVDVKNGEEGAPVVGEVWSFATPASPFEFTRDGNWNDVNNWNGGAVPGNDDRVVLNASATITAEDIITVKDLTITEHASLTINGSLNITGKFSNTDASKLVINDGGQIFQTNAGVQATFNMSIKNPTDWLENNIDGWQFISSPFTDASIDNFVITGDGSDYDLYKFVGNQVGAEWQNQKAIATFDPQFVPGRGYLASYESKEDVSVSGTLRNELTMEYTFGNYHYNVGLKDFHLLGNPFPFDMDMSKLNGMTYNVTEGYAVVNNGSYSYYNLEGTIPAGDGFFVKVTGANATLYYNHVTASKSRNAEQSKSINIIASGNAGNDNVVVNFAGEGEGFPKLQNFNDDIATVYVQNNNANYGIYNCDENTTEIELCFNANQMGNYTISMEPNGNFNSIVLVDRFTGIETNMMVEDYHFTAMSEADNNRFMIKMEAGQQTTDNSQFVYQSGEELVVEAEGTVQIIDVMGRMVYSNDVESNSRINVSDFNNGAYIVRLVNGNGVRTQKVVIY